MKHVRDMKGRRLSLPGNVDDVAQQLEQIWQEIPQVTIRELYHSIPCRVAGYIQATVHDLKFVNRHLLQVIYMQHPTAIMRATSKLLCYYQITSELTDEDEGDKNEVNTGEISENDVPGRVCGHKDKVNVKKPNLTNSYYKHMGGVENHDWFAGLYSTKIRWKKVVLATFYTFPGCSHAPQDTTLQGSHELTGNPCLIWYTEDS
ncbi:UNVERIFIED_CONTAM: hypothetical protein NCL1_42122 [Trichonephila clavipes]